MLARCDAAASDATDSKADSGIIAVAAPLTDAEADAEPEANADLE
jgi:hypothetical protein